MTLNLREAASVAEASAVPSEKKTIARLRPAAPCNAHVFLFASLLFLAPNALFATALRPLPAALTLAGCIGGVALLLRADGGRFFRAPVDGGSLSLCLALGLGLCLLGGEGHFFYSMPDWLIRDAVLADLVRGSVKTLYRYEGIDYLLRAPLGMYLLPAAFGRIFGLFAAHLALVGQNAAIVGVTLYFATALADVGKKPFLLLFVAFSGLDILGVLAANALEFLNGGSFAVPAHLEWWSVNLFKTRLQYSSHLTQLFWVPNHMAPGWWFAAIVLLHARGEIALSSLLVSCAPLFLWSPLAMMGAAPFVVWAAGRASLARLLSRETMCAVVVGLCFLPVALYLVMDAGAVPQEWLILRQGFGKAYLAFIAIEIPQAAVLVYAWRKTPVSDRGPLVVAIIFLLVIPFYSFGPANDFAMRASIPSLFLLAFGFARVAASTPRDNSAFARLISYIVLIAATTPMLELKTALSGAYAVSDCNLVTAWRRQGGPVPTNYFARREKIPDWLFGLQDAPAPLAAENRTCWPDHPHLSDEVK